MNTKIPLICLVGRSGSGKSTIAKCLKELYGLESVESFTTRPRRYENERGHIFISREQYDEMYNQNLLVASTEFDGNGYGVTEDMLRQADVYVVDVAGVETLRHNCSTLPITVFYLDVDEQVSISRQMARGDSHDQVMQRIENDRRMFAGYQSRLGQFVMVNANGSLPSVVEQIVKFVGLQKTEENG